MVCSASSHSALRAATERALCQRFVLGAVLGAQLTRCEPGVRCQVLTAGHRGQQLDQARLEVHRCLHDHVDPVARGEHHGGGRRVRAVAVTDEQPAEQRLQHADVDVGPATRPRPLDQRGQHALRGSGARDEIGDRDRHRHAEASDLAGELERAAERLHRTVGRGLLRRRAVGAEPGDRAVDEPRVGRREVFVRDAQSRRDPGPEVLQQHVRRDDEVAQHLPAGVGLQVEHDAAPVAMQCDVELRRRVTPVHRLPGSRRITTRRLHPHDVGTEIGERARGDRARQERGEVDDAHTVERPCGGGHVGERWRRANSSTCARPPEGQPHTR